MEDTSNTDVEVSLQLVGIPSTMDSPNPANRRGNQQLPTEYVSRSEDERSRQLERLSREEAYYQFINDLSEEDYRLMRDSNLLGTPGEITAEELQQRLNGAKEQLATQSSLENNEHGQTTENQGSELPGESSNNDSLLEWLNTFRRTGNATRSGQSGNQTWRAVSRTNPNSGEFRFSLEININHEHEPISGQTLDTSTLESNTNMNLENAQQQSLSPVASRTRSRTRAHIQPATERASSESNFGAPVRVEEVESMEVAPPMAQRNIRRGTIELTTGRQRSRRQNAHQQAALNAVGQRRISRRRAELQSVRTVHEEEQRRRIELAEFERHRVQTTVSENDIHGQIEQRRSHRNILNRRSRSPLRRESVTVNSSDWIPSRRGDNAERRHIARRQQTVDQSTMTNEEMQTASGSTTVPSSAGGIQRQETMDERERNHSSGSSSVRRHPTIMLDLQVRRIRPGENRDRDSIANRTRSRVRMAENTVTFESDSGGFRRTISRSELAGIRTYVSTIRIPLRRISESGLGEPSSLALRSILRQIMTGFGELSSLMENDSDSELNQRVQQNSPNSFESISSQTRPNLNHSSSRNESTNRLTGDQSARVQGNESILNENEHATESIESRPIQDTNSLVENGTLPILRLAHFFLLNDDDEEERQRGLTKEQIDNLVTRNYGNVSAENEASKTCSVCINDYAVGNKLRRLPCAHEFHIHCIDRWLSENSTCPICRQPIMGSSN
ncbi:E3 ubiquitin-protein ligase RNF6 isoform X2 [Narcine bancroftii]